MHITKTIKSVRELVAQAKAQGKTIGLVPTMGALHKGHVSLINAALERCDFVVVSIFVNPTQFGPVEDLEKYPGDLAADTRICEDAGAGLVFAPDMREMYPDENITWVNVEQVTKNLCGQTRSGHFRGVATVCAKLFNIVCPDIAFFGQKDAQQAIVIKRMVADLNMPLEIVVSPTVRDDDGLAVSSRNQYLSDAERKDALLLHAALKHCAELISKGQRHCPRLIEEMAGILNSSPLVKTEYISIVDTETVENIDKIKDKALIAVAATVGTTRLIDNIIVDLNV